MTKVYWWRPTESPLVATKEAIKHCSSWARLASRHPSVRNFGDEASALAVQHLAETTTQWASISQADLVCVGSILNHYGRNRATADIFGCGVRDPKDSSLAAINPDNIIGLRGKGSCQALRVSNDLAVGDPALVMRDFLPTVATERGRVSVLPHFAAFQKPECRSTLRRLEGRGVNVLTPNLDPVAMYAEISRSEVLLTSSLHGIVFADAASVSVVPVTLSQKSSESDFKYQDYDSIFDGDADQRITWTPAEAVCDMSVAQMVQINGKRHDHVRTVIDQVVSTIKARFERAF